MILHHIFIKIYFRVCKRNRKSKKKKNPRTSTLAPERQCRLVNNRPRRVQHADAGEYVETSVTKQSQPRKPPNDASRGAEPPQPSYEVVDGNDDVAITVCDYSFDNLNRGSRPKLDESLLNDYGHLRLQMESGEYDTAYFRNDKRGDVDSTYACVIKTRKTTKDTDAMSVTSSAAQGEEAALKINAENESNENEEKKQTEEKLGQSESNDIAGTLEKTTAPEETEYEVNCFDKTQTEDKEYPAEKTSAQNPETNAGEESKKSTEYINCKDIQTENSFLMTLKKPEKKIIIKDRYSACTQVTDEDFADMDAESENAVNNDECLKIIAEDTECQLG